MTIAAGLLPLVVDMTRLSPLPNNPRRGDVDAVARSLETFGQRNPIVATTEGVIIAGNHTLAAAKQLGWSEIAVVFVDDDDATAKAFALADNRTAELGGYDNAALAELIADVQAFDVELLAATGWSGDDLLDLLAALEPAAAPLVGDPDEVPVSGPAVTVPGDVWLLGEHRVLCGDSTVPSSFDKVTGGAPVDMVWTDPPYGVAIVGGGGLTIENDDLSRDQLEEFLRAAFTGAAGVCLPGGAWFVTAPSRPLFMAFGVVLADLGIWRQTLVWVKNSLVMGRSDYHYRHEEIFYGWLPGAAHREPLDRTHDTIWEFDRPTVSREHPTMKPVALIEQAILNHTDPGAVVLDPFGGSGSTLIAAHSCGRVARLIEKDPRYVDVICRRFQTLTGIVPIAESSGHEHDFCVG